MQVIPRLQMTCKKMRFLPQSICVSSFTVTAMRTFGKTCLALSKANKSERKLKDDLNFQKGQPGGKVL